MAFEEREGRRLEMSRRGKHMTWRFLERVDADTSLDGQLQTLALSPGPKHTLHWVTVARGKPEDMREIAEALNRARFTLFDISPEAKEMLNVLAHNDGTVGDDSKRVRRSRRELPGGAMARRSKAKGGNKHA